MKYKVVILFLVAALVFAGCARAMSPFEQITDGLSSGESAEYEKAASAPDSTGGNTAATLEDMPKMIIYNGEMSLVVKDTTATQEDITALVESSEGYVSSASSYAYGGGLMRVNLTLRVPADRFHNVMAELRKMAMEVTQESLDSQDVTQEYVDLESRLRALEAKADRLEVLMEEAEDTEAVLAVYQELSSTQQEIEQTKGRMQYLDRSAAMATIQVSLTPDELSQPVEIAGWRPAGVAKEAFEALINVLQFLVSALIWIVILIVPVVIVFGLFFFIFKRVLRRVFKGRRRKIAEQISPLKSSTDRES